MSKNKEVYLVIDGQKMQMYNALIGACSDEAGTNPFSIYAGRLDIGEMGLSFLHTMRCVIKICVDELGLPPEATKEMIEFTMLTAFKLEANQANRDFQKDTNMSEFVKRHL